MDSPTTFLAIFFSLICLIIFFNKIAFGKFLNGMIGTEFSLLFVASVVIHLYLSHLTTSEKLIQYLLVEGTIFISLAFFYKSIIRKRDYIRYCLDYFFEKHKFIPVIVIFIAITVNVLMVPWDGESRIEYQTNYWFTLLRPLITLFYPILVIGFFVHLQNECNRLAVLYLFVIILYSISAGSKASFLIALMIWFFVYRDIYNPNTSGILRKNIPLMLVASLGAIINLAVLDVDLLKVVERLISFGDSAIMLYQAQDPTLACTNLSYLSLMHRGLARVIGDPSAVNIDTLFGFALSIEFYGANTFTGPNARVGPYALCAFPGFSIILFALMFIIYLTMLNALLDFRRILIKTELRIALSLPFVISSINGFMTDYNQGASDISFIILLLIAFVIYSGMVQSCKTIYKN